MPERKGSSAGRRRRFPLIRIALACGLVGWGAPRAAHAIAGSDLFLVREVQLSGGRYLTRAEAAEWTAVPADAHLWDDASGWVTRLSEHPLVRVAEVRRRLPGTLILVIEERQPVALAAAATLQPVDDEGRVLPLDPAVLGLDLPLIKAAATKRTPEAKEGSADAGLGTLAAEAARLQRIDPEFMARTSELAVDERGDLIARWGEPPVAFRFRPAVTARRLEEGMTVLLDAVARTGGLMPRTIDLRFADQVVVQAR
jgi:cell division protein FtsQ